MGLKISQMNPLSFLKGGVGFQNELLEVAANVGDTDELSTYSVRSEDVAALAAPFRTVVSSYIYQPIMDAGETELEMARIYVNDIVKEYIRQGLMYEYDPNDPDSFPMYNMLTSGIMHINLTCILIDGRGYPRRISVVADGICNHDAEWSFGGMTSAAGYIPFSPIPLNTPEPNSDAIWPSSIYFANDWDGKGQYISICTTVSADTETGFELTTFGYIDSVLALSNAS